MTSTNATCVQRWRRLAPLLAFLAAVACANFVPMQGWDPQAGPVVPHDSFPADCSLCHTGSDWHTLREDFTFDHAKQAGVPLVGAHAQAPCLLCHNDRGPVQQFAARGCGGCHADPHLGRLGANCQDCHEERTWVAREAVARHDRTRFPLVGAHAAAACFRCHPGAQVGNFAGAYVECSQCHADDYARTATPNHAAVQFGQDCERCHVPTGWRAARFDHPPQFPLAQGHAGRSCSACHTTPNQFGGLAGAQCVQCHQDDYAATATPPHAAVGFGTDCAQCHRPTRWTDATFDHAFPIRSGRHAGLACTTCHTTPGNFTAFSCIDCHAHGQAAMADRHDEVGGYVCASASCYQCHPDGRN